MKTLSVIRSLGGCGGTLVSRLFSALPDTILISETNPRSANLFGGHLNPIAQIRTWRPDFLEGVASFDDHEIGYPPRFSEMLMQLHGAAVRRNHSLIVRDFNYVDYIGVPFIWPVPGDSSLDIAADGLFQIQDLLLVRFPADQLASLRGHSSINHVLTAQQFLDGYLRMLETKPSVPRFRYEDLVAAPDPTFRAMCTVLGIVHNPVALRDFADVTAVTGNLSRASDGGISAPERSAAAEWAERELSRLPAYEHLLETLGYL